MAEPNQRDHEADARDADRWRTVRPWLAVNHAFDVGRRGVAPTSIAAVEFLRYREHPLRIETPDMGTRGPLFTVEQVVDSLIPPGVPRDSDRRS